MKNGGIRQSNERIDNEFWWKPRTQKQKNVFIAITIVIFLILIISLFLFVFSVKMEICSTSTCVRMSSELSKRIDASVDPCEDFYRFSCGNFLQENTLADNPELRSLRGSVDDEIQAQIRSILEEPIQPEDSRPLNLARKFYISCMDETAIQQQGLRKMKQIFREIGGWPTLDGKYWHEDRFNWLESIGILRGIGVNFDVFFTVSIDRDKHDPSRHILGIHDTQYSPAELKEDIRKFYLDYMVDVVVLFGANKHKAKEDSNEILDMFLRLSKISEESRLSNRSNIYDRLTLSELQYQYSSIDWHQYLNKILYPVEEFKYDDELVVADPVYLKKMESILRSTPKRVLSNFIVWHTIQYLINYLPTEILDRAHGYLEQVNMKNMKAPRWSICLKATRDKMNSVIGAAFIQRFFHDDVRSDILELITNIKDQFRRNLLRLEWFDRATKDLVLEKLLTSVVEVVSYGDLLNILEENRIYNQVNITNRTFLESVLDLDRIKVDREFSKMRKPYEQNLFKDSNFVTGRDIIYIPKTNTLIFPVGIFRGMFFKIERPHYMNYAILGSMVAHEISHIFMEAEHGGSRGELRSWWSPASLVEYDEKLGCLSNQYRMMVQNKTIYFESHWLELITPILLRDNGKHPCPNAILMTIDIYLRDTFKFAYQHLEGMFVWILEEQHLTRDEDMADLAGMKIAYDAYIHHTRQTGAEPLLPGLKYSPNQLFWISASVRHCVTMTQRQGNSAISPPSYRVNGPLQNLEEFTFDFACPVGSKMNPEQKCNIW